MMLTIQIDDRDFTYLKEELRVRKRDFDNVNGGRAGEDESARLYAKRILYARKALGLTNSDAESIVPDDKL